jgi:hypothetical protein
MTAGPDDLLIELFQCHEPQRWQLNIPKPAKVREWP